MLVSLLMMMIPVMLMVRRWVGVRTGGGGSLAASHALLESTDALGGVRVAAVRRHEPRSVATGSLVMMMTGVRRGLVDGGAGRRGRGRADAGRRVAHPPARQRGVGDVSVVVLRLLRGRGAWRARRGTAVDGCVLRSRDPTSVDPVRAPLRVEVDPRGRVEVVPRRGVEPPAGQAGSGRLTRHHRAQRARLWDRGGRGRRLKKSSPRRLAQSQNSRCHS